MSLADEMREMAALIRRNYLHPRPSLIRIGGLIHGILRERSITCSDELLKMLKQAAHESICCAEALSQPIQQTPQLCFAGYSVSVDTRFPCRLFEIPLQELAEFVDPSFFLPKPMPFHAFTED